MQYRVMCQTDIDYLARKERCKDLLQEAERERLIQSMRPKQPVLRTRIAKGLVSFAARRPGRPHSDGVMAEHQP